MAAHFIGTFSSGLLKERSVLPKSKSYVSHNEIAYDSSLFIRKAYIYLLQQCTVTNRRKEKQPILVLGVNDSSNKGTANH